MNFYMTAYNPRRYTLYSALDTDQKDLNRDSHHKLYQMAKKDIHGSDWGARAFRFTSKKGKLIKITYNPLESNFLIENQGEMLYVLGKTDDIEWIKKERDNRKRATLTYYPREDNYKILVVDDINDKSHSALIANEIKSLHDRKIIIAIKDPDELTYTERKKTFSKPNQYESLMANPGLSLDPEKLAKSGYFLENTNLRCTGCQFTISINECNNVITKERGETSSSQEEALITIDEIHDRNKKKIVGDSYYQLYDTFYGAKPCLRDSEGGNTLIYTKDHNNQPKEVQCYKELEVVMESGYPTLKVIHNTSIIPTDPENQLITIGDLACGNNSRFKSSELYKTINGTIKKFDEKKEALKKIDPKYRASPIYQCLVAKISLLHSTKDPIENLYVEIDKNKWNKPEEKEESKQRIKDLLEDLLSVIDTIKTDDQGLGFLLRRAMTSPNPSIPPSPCARLEEEGHFAESHLIDNKNVEIAQGFLVVYTKEIIRPIIEIMGDDYWQLDSKIRKWVFFEPNEQPPAKHRKTTNVSTQTSPVIITEVHP